MENEILTQVIEQQKEGIQFLSKGAFSQAEQAFQGALQLDAQSASTMSNLGYTLSLQGRYQDAISWYNKALAIQPEASFTLCNIGQAQLMMGMIDEGIASIKKSLESDDTNMIAWDAMGKIMLMAQNGSQAEEAFSKVLNAHPDKLSPYVGLSKALLLQGKFDEVQEVSRMGLRLEPEEEELWYLNAFAEFQNNNFGNAKDVVRQALALNPDHIKSRSLLANIFVKEGEAEKAMKEFQHILLVKPDMADVQVELGVLHLSMGQLAEAKICLQDGLVEENLVQKSNYYLGLSYHSESNIEETVKHLSALPESSEYYEKAKTIIDKLKNN